MNFNEITVVVVGGVNTTVTVEAGKTLKDVLEIFEANTGIKVSTYDVRVGDQAAAMTVVPGNGTKVYLVTKVKGRA